MKTKINYCVNCEEDVKFPKGKWITLSKFYVLLYNVVWRSVPFQWHTTVIYPSPFITH